MSVLRPFIFASLLAGSVLAGDSVRAADRPISGPPDPTPPLMREANAGDIESLLPTGGSASASSASPGDPAASDVAFIGVATSIVSPSLREQLNLPRGIGLVIDSVDPDSPAGLAGLQPHDVIEKLDDQFLINVQQLAVLVRLHNPGDRITLAIIRKGRPLKTEVALGGRWLPPVDEDAGALLLADGAAGDVADPRAFPLPRPGLGRISGILRHADADHSIVITMHDGSQTVCVTDAHTGRPVYEGPLGSADDRAKIPQGLREKIEKVETTGRHVRNLHAAPARREND